MFASYRDGKIIYFDNFANDVACLFGRVKTSYIGLSSIDKIISASAIEGVVDVRIKEKFNLSFTRFSKRGVSR